MCFFHFNPIKYMQTKEGIYFDNHGISQMPVKKKGVRHWAANGRENRVVKHDSDAAAVQF